MSKDNSEPAFPSDSNEFGAVLGMSLRDYFAAKCAQALPAPSFYIGPQQTKESLERWARQAFQMADAMLAARSA